MCYLIYHTACKKCGEDMYKCKCEDDNEWFAVAEKMQQDINESSGQKHNTNG